MVLWVGPSCALRSQTVQNVVAHIPFILKSPKFLGFGVNIKPRQTASVIAGTRICRGATVSSCRLIPTTTLAEADASSSDPAVAVVQQHVNCSLLEPTRHHYPDRQESIHIVTLVNAICGIHKEIGEVSSVV